jgi:hypothetical protein
VDWTSGVQFQTGSGFFWLPMHVKQLWLLDFFLVVKVAKA